MTYHSMVDRVQQLKGVQDEALALFSRKNADYGDAFAQYGPVGVLVRLGDKMSRAQSISRKGVTLVDEECLRDTLLDLHNYAAMGVMLLDERTPDAPSGPSTEVGTWDLHVDPTVVDDVLHSRPDGSFDESLLHVATGLHHTVCGGLIPVETCATLAKAVLESYRTEHGTEECGDNACEELAAALRLAAAGADVLVIDAAIRSGESMVANARVTE